MFQDMRVNTFHDDERTRCNKVFNMINMIRNDILFEKPIFDSDTVKIAAALAKEIKRLQK